MAPHRKIPILLLPVLLILLAGAVVLLLRGQPLTLERILDQRGYTITSQTGTDITFTLARSQMPQNFPETAVSAEEETEVLLLQSGDTSLYLTAFAQSETDSGLLRAVIELRHTLSRGGGELLLPYQVDGGGVSVGLRLNSDATRADGEARPEAVTLDGQTASGRLELSVDRALFLRSDQITFQLGPFYSLTYEPA